MIRAAPHTHRSPRRTGPLATHDHGSLLYVTSGATVFEQGARFEVGPGDVVLVPPGAPHRTLPGGETTGWGIGFTAPASEPDPFARVRAGGTAVVRIPDDRRTRLAEMCSELARETREQRAHAELARRHLLSLVLVEVTRAASVLPAVAPSLVGDALQFIEQHCLGPLSLADVAAAVGRSRAHVTTAVRRATGKSVGEWITAGRMAEARTRLVHTDERVEIIAERVGYADATHFARTFRRAHGTSPIRWRRSSRAPGSERG